MTQALTQGNYSQNISTVCLLSKQRHLNLAGRQSGFHVNQQSLLGKNIGALFFGGLDEHLWGKYWLLSLLLPGVAKLRAYPTAG